MLGPAAGAHLPDLFKHGIAIEKLSAVGLLGAATDLGPQFLNRSFACLFPFGE